MQFFPVVASSLALSNTRAPFSPLIMAGTLPVGHWSWHERWLYPDQIRDLPDRPLSYVRSQEEKQAAMERRLAQDAALTKLQQQTSQGLAPTQLLKPQPPLQQTVQQFHPRPPSHAQQQPQQQQFQPHPPAPQQLQQTQQFQPQPPSSQHPQQAQQLQQNGNGYASTFQPQQQQQQQQQFSNNFSLDLTALKEHEEEKQQQMASSNGYPIARNNPQAIENTLFPSLPRRYRDGTFRRMTSEYCYTFRDPAQYSEDLGATASGSASARVAAVPGSRLPERSRGRLNAPKTFLHHHFSNHYYETEEERARVRPEQHSFRLWGRINNAHCVMSVGAATYAARVGKLLEDLY